MLRFVLASVTAIDLFVQQAGFTPLLQASQDGNLGIVKLLVEHDEDTINQHTDVSLCHTATISDYNLATILNRLAGQL